MRLIRDLDVDNPCPGGSAVTIGNFDGLHRGHLALIDAVRDQARERGLRSVVTSFDPLAREFFAPERSPARIYNASERLRLLARESIDLVWLMRFGRELADTDAREFVRRYLLRGLDMKWLTVGGDFRFGRGREGDVELLRQLGREAGFEVVVAPEVTVDGERVSSTLVREALNAGDFERVERLLGRPFSMYGRVVRGLQLGRKLGYPTANIRLHRRRSPIHGIYAVQVSGAGLAGHPAVASVGVRPTVDGKEMLLEVHLFDFDGDLYGRHLDVRLVEKLREEERFESLEALTDQMRIDAARARSLLVA